MSEYTPEQLRETPLGSGPEGAVSKHADLLNDLEDMAGSYAYAVRRETLRRAGRVICDLEREHAAALVALKARLSERDCQIAQLNFVLQGERAAKEKAEAERDENKADAEQWRAYKARKDRVISAGMGRSPLRAAHKEKP